MKKSIKKYSILVVLLVSIGISFSFRSDFFEVAKQIEIYNTLFKELNMYYVDEINPAEFTNKAIKNTLKDLDPYTNYYNEQDVEEAKIKREGEYAGVGVAVYYDKTGITLAEIYKGYSADKAGLKAGDIITKVDGEPLQNMEREQLSEFLKGTPNSSVSVEISREGKTFTTTLTREKVSVNPVAFYDLIDEETGYIVLTRFSNKASAEVKKAFKALKKKGMKKLVFDLRGNPGGSLLEAINISNFFLPKGSTIVSTKAKVKKWSNTYRATNNPLDLDMPITVLVDGSSASASEIVSGALQDYDRAVILGERSFGKGLVQRYRNLNYGTQLKVTISKYYTPSGRCIQELDYANRDTNGKVPKFSDGGVNKFTTQNGRTVYDGGGVMPDVSLKISKKTDETKKLLRSRAVFNFTTDYFYQNKEISDVTKFRFSDADFKSFEQYLLKDTTFVTKQEKSFKEAMKTVKDVKMVSQEYKKIQQKLKKDKINKISINEDILKVLLQEEVVSRYYYEEGVYQNKLKNDIAIIEATRLLKDIDKYNNILVKK
ncbi:S41 family peptidase [Flavobacteriaceae bacterium S356]|uniref:S41 family peptidase n=1 Tax=Asprobacillus argus TaxID=3076534 RepID=A0ABU3LBN0_9FLAO|nr:S41 family peptidase [Flavobacteriaceae bacterium S356]